MIPLRIIGQDPPVKVGASRPAAFNLWGYGFRPFFLLGSAAATALIALWLVSLAYIRNLSPGLSGPLWHAHEMYFGFTTAIIAGFLLTAVPNWTGIPTPRGRPLAALTLIWFLGRLASWQGAKLAWLDLAFLPLLALVLAGPLVRARKLNNVIFLPVLGWLAMANAAFWWGIHQQQFELSRQALSATLYAILTLIAIIAGRVIPFFTEKAIDGYRARKWMILELACGLSLVAGAVAEIQPGWAASTRAGVLFVLLAKLVAFPGNARPPVVGAVSGLRIPTPWAGHEGPGVAGRGQPIGRHPRPQRGLHWHDVSGHDGAGSAGP